MGAYEVVLIVNVLIVVVVDVVIQDLSLFSNSELKQNQEAAQTARPSAQATQKKPTIYEYQQKQPL